VHFARNLLALIPRSHKDMVAALFRTIFAQPDRDAVSTAWEEIRGQLVKTFPKVGPLMDTAKAEVPAFTAFPKAHWIKIWSNNPLVIWSRSTGVRDVVDEAVRSRVLPGGRGYLPRSSTRRPGRFDVRCSGGVARFAA
jgi:hypothetical protein